MPGPLPNPNRRRRNAPTVPTTDLPAGGRRGRAPSAPYDLGEAGRAWWSWAWTLPQACAWSRGDLYAIARRASLEDDVAAVSFGDDDVTLYEILTGADFESVKRVEGALMSLKRLVTGKLALSKEMRELDVKLGLTPESMAKLRWRIVEEEEEVSATYTPPPLTVGPRTGGAPPPASPRHARTHLRAVDPGLSSAVSGLPSAKGEDADGDSAPPLP